MQQNRTLCPKLGWYPELGHFMVSYREKHTNSHSDWEWAKMILRMLCQQVTNFCSCSAISNQFLCMPSQPVFSFCVCSAQPLIQNKLSWANMKAISKLAESMWKPFEHIEWMRKCSTLTSLESKSFFKQSCVSGLWDHKVWFLKKKYFMLVYLQLPHTPPPPHTISYLPRFEYDRAFLYS